MVNGVPDEGGAGGPPPLSATKPDPESDDVEEREPEGKEDPLYHPKRWIIGSSILIIGLVLGFGIFYYYKTLGALGIMGLIVFFTVLIGTDIFSGTTKLNTGEVRKATTVSFIAVYFTLMGFEGTINADQTILSELFKNFWWIVAVIIAFYFGGRSAKQVANVLKERAEKLQDQ